MMERLDYWIAQAWWVLPLIIMLARIVDVTLGTLRVIFISRGYRLLAPVCGFFEVLIWITAMSQIIRNVEHFASFFAYAAGYALGTVVGMLVESRLALGTLIVRVITQANAEGLLERLRREHFRVTSLDAEGSRGPVKILFTVVRRARLTQLLELVKAFNPKAFYTIEDVRAINEGTWPRSQTSLVPRRPGQ